MALEQYANNQATVLNGAINDSTTSVVVVDGSVFPSAGDFRVRIDSEVMLCTARTTNTLTVTRGVESTSAAAHATGANVDGILTSEGLQQLVGVNHQTGTVAALPTPAREGLIYSPNDGIYLYRDSGAAWVPWGPLYPMTEPVSGDFSWVNQGGASVDTTNGGIWLQAPPSATTNVRARVKSAPSTPYTITAWIKGAIGNTGQHVGLCWRQNSTGEFVTWGPNGPDAEIQSHKYTNATTYSAQYTLIEPVGVGNGLICLRLADDGVNRTVSYSVDGQHFIGIHQVGRTDFLTADEVGFCANEAGNFINAGLLLLSWEEG